MRTIGGNQTLIHCINGAHLSFWSNLPLLFEFGACLTSLKNTVVLLGVHVGWLVLGHLVWRQGHPRVHLMVLRRHLVPHAHTKHGRTEQTNRQNKRTKQTRVIPLLPLLSNHLSASCPTYVHVRHHHHVRRSVHLSMRLLLHTHKRHH